MPSSKDLPLKSNQLKCFRQHGHPIADCHSQYQNAFGPIRFQGIHIRIVERIFILD